MGKILYFKNKPKEDNSYPLIGQNTSKHYDEITKIANEIVKNNKKYLEIANDIIEETFISG